MKRFLIFLSVALNSVSAFADTEKTLDLLFPNNSAGKCAPKIIVDQKIEDLQKRRILAFMGCNKKGAQDEEIRVALYEESPVKLISQGHIARNKDAVLHDILLKPEDSKIADNDRTFQLRLQYKLKDSEALQEELVLARDSGKEISAILRGPVEDFPGSGRAFLIITKQKTNGFADVAIKSEHKTEAFRWRGTAYAPFTREEINALKK